MDQYVYVSCSDCRGTGQLAGQECWHCSGVGGDVAPVCTGCREIIGGCVWNGGRCLHCHEAALLPESDLDRWAAAYAD